jgi:hypothetical protein
MRYAKQLVLAAAALFLISSAFGCERKPEDLEKWRNAKGGLEKIQGWATSPDETKAVRIRAAEILVEDGRPNNLQPTLDAIEDEELRDAMVEAALPIVEAKWAEQDMPQLSDEVKEEGGAVQAGPSEAVKAKDAAYFLQPYAKGESKKKLESILAEWLSEDWQLRNKLGVTTLGQLAERAGPTGVESLLAWLEEAVEPHAVLEMIDEYADDDARDRAAKIILARVEEAHPELSPTLQVSIFSFEHKAFTPYLKKVISDPSSPPQLIDRAMNALVENEGERSAPFFTDLVKTRKGLLRRVAATRLVEVLGKPAFSYVATGLPIEMDAYPPVEEDSFREDLAYFCNLYHSEMQENEVSSVDDQLRRGLSSNRWPAKALALQCARKFKSVELKADIEKLSSDEQKLPGFGGETSVGELADEVLDELSKT